MKENFIDKLPIKIIYSFQSLIEELERSEYNFGEFKAFLEYLKATRPELINGVETFEDFQKIIKDVEPIIEKIIPNPFVKYNLKEGLLFTRSFKLLSKPEISSSYK